MISIFALVSQRRSRLCLAAMVAAWMILYSSDSHPGVNLQAQDRHAAVSEYYVSPAGSPAGDGSEARPWDLATALKHPAAVLPGDRIWLRGGAYSGVFESNLAGSPSAPIVVAQFPGERATIDGGSSKTSALVIHGEWTWYWGFEVRFSDPVRVSTQPGSSPTDINMGGCVVLQAPGVKLINLVLHDCTQGVSFWVPSIDAEVHGCIIYYNGYSGPDRSHGHGIYTQNDTGRKAITDNIIFNQFGLGIQAFSTAAAQVRSYDVMRNIVFNNGTLQPGGFGIDNILFAGGKDPKSGINIIGNHSYHTPDRHSGYSRLGWQWDGDNSDIVVRDNYWIGGGPAVGLWNWAGVTFEGNTVFSEDTSVELAAKDTSNYSWNRNRYFGTGSFKTSDGGLLWDNWKSTTGLDKDSAYQPGRPSGVWTFVTPNQYEPGRGNIVVYNWDKAPAVAVDLSGVVRVSAEFEIRDAQNFFGAPILAGRYAGGSVTIPMTGLSVAAPVGQVPHPPTHTAPEFGVFVVTSDGTAIRGTRPGTSRAPAGRGR